MNQWMRPEQYRGDSLKQSYQVVSSHDVSELVQQNRPELACCMSRSIDQSLRQDDPMSPQTDRYGCRVLRNDDLGKRGESKNFLNLNGDIVPNAIVRAAVATF